MELALTICSLLGVSVLRLSVLVLQQFQVIDPIPALRHVSEQHPGRCQTPGTGGSDPSVLAGLKVQDTR